MSFPGIYSGNLHAPLRQHEVDIKLLGRLQFRASPQQKRLASG